MGDELRVGQQVRVTVQRWDPQVNSDPEFVTYEVPYTREMRVLEALDYIVEELGEPLAYQWYCGVKKCGKCAMTIDGRPGLACWEAMRDDVLVEPLAGFDVVRDLVIDTDDYDRAVDALDVRLHRVDDYPGFPEPLRPSEMADALELSRCIECLVCTSACPASTEDGAFAGPAVAVQLAQFVQDPRDQADRGAEARAIGMDDACEDCRCDAVCPMDISIGDLAIAPLRRLAGTDRATDG